MAEAETLGRGANVRRPSMMNSRGTARKAETAKRKKWELQGGGEDKGAESQELGIESEETGRGEKSQDSRPCVRSSLSERARRAGREPNLSCSKHHKYCRHSVKNARVRRHETMPGTQLQPEPLRVSKRAQTLEARAAALVICMNIRDERR